MEPTLPIANQPPPVIPKRSLFSLIKKYFFHIIIFFIIAITSGVVMADHEAKSTTNWETFTSKEAGISFKHPKAYKIVEDKGWRITIYPSEQTPENNIKILYSHKDPSLAESSAEETFLANCQANKVSQIDANNTRIKAYEDSTCGGQVVPNSIIVYSENGMSYDIGLFGETDRNKLYQLLSTFQFTNSALSKEATPLPSTEALKTYTNATYGYSIQYPSEHFINCDDEGDEFFLFAGNACALGEQPTEIYIIPKTAYYKPMKDSTCVKNTVENVTIGGVAATKYSREISNDTNQFSNFETMKCNPLNGYKQDSNVYYNVEHNGQIFEILTALYDKQEIKNQILSTFKFTSQTNAEGLKTYTNSAYGFTMSYPQEGIILNSESKTVAGTCGNAIKEKPGASGELNLVFDNFFGITSTTWPGSIESFIRHGDPNGYITYAPIEGTNADEAVSITGVIRDSEILPLGNAFSLYKKGSKIFTIRHLPNAENVNGCIYINRDLPTFFKAENYPGVSIEEYTKLHKAHVAWNIPASFKFTKATTQPTTKAEQTAICTMDAKICADGTTVGRTGSKCEFVCPGGKASQ